MMNYELEPLTIGPLGIDSLEEGLDTIPNYLLGIVSIEQV